MKLMLIHHVADIYGASKSLLRLSSRLVRDGHSVLVVLPEDGPLRNELEQSNVMVEIISGLPVLHRNRLASIRGIWLLLRDTLAFRREIKKAMLRYRPDVVHTNTAAILPVTGNSAHSLNILRIQHVRESFLDFGMLWPVYRWWLYRNADRVICISSFIASTFSADQRAGKIQVVHNGIPREEFEQINQSEVRAFRDAYSKGGPLIGIAGRIKLIRKGQEVFVKAAARIKDLFPTAQFVIVGSPFPGNESHLEELKKLVHESGLESRVHFTGHLDNPLVAISAFDISVMASTSPEPLGNVTIESMALGIPVIGTDVGGTTEIIENGKTGLLVAPGDAEAMAAAMGKLLSNPEVAREMGRRARERYLEHFEFMPFYRTMQKIYGIISQ